MTDKITAGGLSNAAVLVDATPVVVGQAVFALPQLSSTNAEMYSVPLYPATATVAGRYNDLPLWYGTGTLSAPASPYNVTYAASPAGCIVDLYDDLTGLLILSTAADPTTGAFTFSGLNTARTFSVRARGAAFPVPQNDQILSGLTPG